MIRQRDANLTDNLYPIVLFFLHMIRSSDHEHLKGYSHNKKNILNNSYSLAEREKKNGAKLITRGRFFDL